MFSSFEGVCMAKLKRTIETESDYLKCLEQMIPSVESQEHFSAAVQWRQKQAELYRRRYYLLQWINALLGVAIVIISSFQVGVISKSITIIGSVSTLVSFALSLHKYYDSWKRYRSSLEDIKSLTRIFLSKNKPFDESDDKVNEKRYILELDKIISAETSGWKEMCEKKL